MSQELRNPCSQLIALCSQLSVTMLNLSEYHRPGSIAEAIELLGRKTPRTVVLGGGTWLNGEGALRNLQDIRAVVDVADLGLNRIETVTVSESDRPPIVRIGAAVTHQTLVEHPTTGLTADSASHPRPSRSMTPGRKLLATMSASAARARTSATPASLFRSTLTLFLFRLVADQWGL